MDVRIIKILRKKDDLIPNRLTRIEQNDILLVECKMDDFIKIKESVGLDVLADTLTNTEIQSNKIRLVEVLVTPGSPLLDRSLKDIKFRQNYDLVVLGIHRFGETVAEKIGNLKLKIGDVLLVQGTEEAINTAKKMPEFSIVGDFKMTLFMKKKGVFTAMIFLIAILVSALNLIPLSIAFLTAALLTVVVGAIDVNRVYHMMNWKLLVLIGGMSSFGTALHNSGASEFLAKNIIKLLGDFGVMYVLAGFIILVIILTQPMSNAAAALVVLPIAIESAQILNSDPRTFAIAIMLGSSVSLIAPFEPSCILVYSPGKYKFAEFIKAGLPLTIILFLLILFLVPVFWSL
jgi:di/tricarboxylate transporter